MSTKMNSFNIIYSGIFKHLILKIRTKNFFKNIPHVKRNNVVSIKESNFAIHIKKNMVHISLCEKYDYSQNLIENYISTVFFDTNIGFQNFERSILDCKNISFIKI